MEKKIFEKSEILRYLCFALFAVYTVVAVLPAIPIEAIGRLSIPFSHFSNRVQGIGFVVRAIGFRYVLMLAEGALICVGLLTKKRILPAAAFLLLAVGKALSILKLLRFGVPAMGALSELALLTAFVAAAFCCLTKSKNAWMLGIICAVLLLLGDILFVMFFHRYVFADLVFPAKFYLRNIFFYAAFVLLGFVCAPDAAAVKSPETVSIATVDKIEQLTMLKDLLDKGILTREEFEEKKKQILGL